MGTGIPQKFSPIRRSYTGHDALHGNDRTDLEHEPPAKVAVSNARMRLLHFENAFGEAHASEYCLAAMLCLVLIMVRNSRPDATRLARLIATADAACPAKDKLCQDNATVAPTRRAS